MSGSDRDLVMGLQAELAAIDPARACDRRAETAGLHGGRTTRRGPVTRLVLRLGRDRRTSPPLSPPASRPARPPANPPLSPPASRPARSPAGPDDLPPAAFDWDGSPAHCRMAWLRGLFLARGSLSLAGGRTHLEFVVDPADAALLTERLAAVGLPASWRIRRGRGVVTWKNGDTVGLFLRRIGAGASLLELEVRQVSRALRGDLNRLINAESANLQRAVGAAGRQMAAIDELTARGELADQPTVVQTVAGARHETPEATLGELAERLGLHRSAVQRALERLERLALLPADDERRGPRRRRGSAGRAPKPAPAHARRGRPSAAAGVGRPLS